MPKKKSKAGLIIVIIIAVLLLLGGGGAALYDCVLKDKIVEMTDKVDEPEVNDGDEETDATYDENANSGKTDGFGIDENASSGENAATEGNEMKGNDDNADNAGVAGESSGNIRGVKRNVRKRDEA